MKILVVEDEKRVAEYIKKGLEIKSYVVDTAYDGQQGLDFALSEAYDLIILDWMLPHVSGQEVLKEIRRAEKHTPVLMLTAKTGADNVVKGLDNGADDYLSKPFAFSELLARVRALIRRRRQPLEAVLSADNLHLNTTTYKVERDGQEINLSKREFALLEFLLRHSGQVFSKEELAEKVWSFDSNILPNTVQVYIGYLRKKIDKPFKNYPELIKTVRGFGYKLESSKLKNHKNKRENKSSKS